MFKKHHIKDKETHTEENNQQNPFSGEPSESEANSENIAAASEDAVCFKEFSELKRRFEKIQEEKSSLDAQYLRLAADFDNFRKRQETERESLLKYGAEDTLRKFFAVIDTFERAQRTFKEFDDATVLKESFFAVQKQLYEALEKLGVEKIETQGQEFDPNFHEAVMQTPTSEYPEHTIISELQTGYRLCDKVLRPALVNVAVAE